MLDFAKKSRIRILAIATLVLMVVFVSRLFYMQIVQHDYYIDLARKEQTKQFDLPAERGEIYVMDSNGKPKKIVLNEVIYTVFADPKIVEDVDKVASVVRRVAGGTTVSDIAARLAKKDSRYQIIATKITRAQAEMIKKERLVGIGFQRGTRRVYPEGQLAAQVLGFVNDEGNGQYGVEGKLDDRLKGTDGKLVTVTDVRDIPLTVGKENIHQPAKNGQNIALSIDRNIQAFTEKAIADGMKRTDADLVSAVVMDPNTGQVLAMANTPTYRPDQVSKVEDVALFNNTTISEPYEPASVFKTFTMSAALEKGVITPTTTYVNTDYTKVQDRTIQNATKGQTGKIDMQRVLTWSLNTGTVQIARWLGDGQSITYGARQTIYDYFHNKFRLDQKTGIELAGEVGGLILSPDDPDGNDVRYSNMTFGQGLDVTMIQVATGFCSVVNGGSYYAPTVVAGSVDNDGNFSASKPRLVASGIISESTSSTMRGMLVNARRAFYATRDRAGYQIGGKTGTSQGIIDGQYSFKQQTASYIGFGGTDKPSYVVMVRVFGKEKAYDGGKDAQPIFTDISNKMIDYLKLQPKG